MKRLQIPLLILLSSLLLLSCSKDLYKLSPAKKKAYKTNLKHFKNEYKRFTPVKLDLDSLNATQLTAHSPNFNGRKPGLVIIHHTAQNSCTQSVETLSNHLAPGPVSSHYLICKDGTVFNLVDEKYRAWHGGIGRWGNMTDINSISLGIEIDNNGDEPFPEAQINSLLVLLKSIKGRYGIRQSNFIGHADIAPQRKPDPNIYFPWKKLAEEGFGYSVDEELEDIPENFDTKAALRLIGYDVSDLRAATIAFKRHFIQKDIEEDLNENDKKVLYNIYQKALDYRQ